VAVTSQMCIHDFVHVTVFLLTFTYKSYVLYCLYCIWLPFVGCLTNQWLTDWCKSFLMF